MPPQRILTPAGTCMAMLAAGLAGLLLRKRHPR
jgi:hypothetical protein